MTSWPNTIRLAVIVVVVGAVVVGGLVLLDADPELGPVRVQRR